MTTREEKRQRMLDGYIADDAAPNMVAVVTAEHIAFELREIRLRLDRLIEIFGDRANRQPDVEKD